MNTLRDYLGFFLIPLNTTNKEPIFLNKSISRNILKSGRYSSIYKKIVADTLSKNILLRANK